MEMECAAAKIATSELVENLVIYLYGSIIVVLKGGITNNEINYSCERRSRIVFADLINKQRFIYVIQCYIAWPPLQWAMRLRNFTSDTPEQLTGR